MINKKTILALLVFITFVFSACGKENVVTIDSSSETSMATSDTSSNSPSNTSVSVGSSTNLTSSQKTISKGPTQKSTSKAAWKYETPSGPPYNITICFTHPSDKEDPPLNNSIKKQLEKRTNTKITLIRPPLTSYYEKVNLMVVSNKLPDVIGYLRTNDIINFSNQNAIIPLDSLLSKYGEIFYRYIPKSVFVGAKNKGKIYGIPNYFTPGKFNIFVRKDWMDKLGLKPPKTVNELYNLLKAFTYNDPDGNGKNDTFGLTAGGLGGLELIFNAYGVQPEYWYLSNGQLLPYDISDGMRDALAMLNKLYKEKILDNEFIVNKSTDHDSKIISGKVGIWSGWWSTISLEDSIKNLNSKAVIDIIEPVNKITASSQIGRIVAITKAAKDPERVMNFLSFLISDEGTILTTHGIENSDYVLKNGKFTTGPNFKNSENWIQAFNLFNRQERPKGFEDVRPERLTWSMRIAEKNTKLIMNAADGLLPAVFMKYSADLYEYKTTSFIDFIIGEKPISEWDEFVETWKTELHGNEVIKAMNDEYKTKK